MLEVEELSSGLVVVGVTGPAGVDVSPEVGAQQGEVTDAVEDFVSSAFVGEQERVVDRSVGSEDEQVVVSESVAESLFPEGFDFAVEDECAAAGDFDRELIGVEDKRTSLWPDG
jgi:hypothetical protein